MEFDDLAVLTYADNECYTNVMSFEDALRKHKSFYVDLEKMKWGYGNKEFDIGKSRYIERHRHFGVIGVYIKESIKQLNPIRPFYLYAEVCF